MSTRTCNREEEVEEVSVTILFHWHMERIEGAFFCVATGQNYEINLPNNQLRDGQQRSGCLALERIQQRLNKDLHLHSILQFPGT